MITLLAAVNSIMCRFKKWKFIKEFKSLRILNQQGKLLKKL